MAGFSSGSFSGATGGFSTDGAATGPFTTGITGGPPAGRSRSAAPFIWFNCAIITLAAGLPFEGEARDPVKRKAIQQPGQAQNLLLTTLGVAPAEKPFKLDQWEFSPPKRKIQQPEYVQNEFPLTVPAVGELPHHKDDWPNPLSAKRGLVFDPQNNLPLTTPVIEELPPSQKDWPNPKAAKRGQVLDPQNSFPLTVPADGELPLSPKDWQNPTIKTSIDRGFEQSRPSYFEEPVVGTPFVPIEFPNPLAANWARKAFLPWFNVPIVEDVQPSGTPFYQSDWQNPVVLGPRLNEGFTQARPTYYEEPPPGSPFIPVDWQNPQKRQTKPIVFDQPYLLDRPLVPSYTFREALVSPPVIERTVQQLEQAQNLFSTLLGEPPAVAPFKTDSWGFAPQARSAQQPENPANLLTTLNFVETPAPFYQSDWQNPKGPEFPVSNRGFEHSFPDLDSIPPPVIPPVVVDEAPRPSGGIPHDYKRTKKDVSKDRLRFGIKDKLAEEAEAKAGAIIADVAARQVERLERDQQKIFEELLRELQLEGLEFDARYLEALARQREALLDQEIARQFRRIEEEELMLLVMIAGSL